LKELGADQVIDYTFYLVSPRSRGLGVIVDLE
jgi:hypothetical protein